MSELICELTAHRAGFIVSVGNWIAPDGTLITGTDCESHHWETIKAYFGFEPKVDNHLTWMNQKVEEGFLRLVFRSDVLFQIGSGSKEIIWDEQPNHKMMRQILGRMPDIEVHIFSKNFYVIGMAQDIVDRNISGLQIEEKSC